MKKSDKDIHTWHFKTTDDIIDKAEIPNVITCHSETVNGNQCITLPSKLNGQDYANYGTVKPLWYKGINYNK